jgi:hypothetical protein
MPVRRHQLTQRSRRHMASPPEPEPERRTANWSAVTSVITALTAVGALIFTALSLNATRDQIAVAEQGQYTDRYSRAVEQLGQQGPDRLQIRLGGIYALERLARDSPRDQSTIIEVLTTFVRTSASPRANRDISCSDTPPTPDVQAVLTVLGRRIPAHDSGVKLRLNNLCLVGANLASANLNKADLDETDLRNGYLVDANMKGASLNEAILSDTNLSDADLSGAFLTGANFTNAELNHVTLVNAELTWAIFTNSTIFGADFTGANLEYVSIDGAHSDSNTKGLNR